MKTASKPAEKTIEVLGKDYVVRLWKEGSGHSYSVRDCLAFGWSDGDLEDALKEAEVHIKNAVTPGWWQS